MIGQSIDIIWRVTAIYLIIIVTVWLLGKKEISQLSVSDLIFVMLLSERVQNAMVGPDDSFLGGVVALATLFAINSIMEYLLYRFPKFSKILEGEPVVLIYKGKVNDKNYRKSHISIDKLKRAIRRQGVMEIEKVDLYIFEIDGNVSVLSNVFSKTEKQD